MSLIDFEQIKLPATALNTAAIACFAVGIATPIAGYPYNVGGLRTVLPIWILVGDLVVRSVAAIALHLIARRVLGRLRA